MKRGGMAASPEQREKVRAEYCRKCGKGEAVMAIDPAHVIARAQGGCDEGDCVIPLCRYCHRRFDHDRNLDVLPLLSREEQAHAVRHVGLISALERTTCRAWQEVDG